MEQTPPNPIIFSEKDPKVFWFHFKNKFKINLKIIFLLFILILVLVLSSFGYKIYQENNNKVAGQNERNLIAKELKNNFQTNGGLANPNNESKVFFSGVVSNKKENLIEIKSNQTPFNIEITSQTVIQKLPLIIDTTIKKIDAENISVGELLVGDYVEGEGRYFSDNKNLVVTLIAVYRDK